MSKSLHPVIKKKKNEKGILTLDFVFAMTATYAIAMVFVLLAMTLMMSTIVQYISFSMARSHISADMTIGDQQDAVQERMDVLLGSYLGKFLKPTDDAWFKIETPASAGTLIADPGWGGASAGASRQKAYGVGIKYTSLILKNAKLPLIGSPSDGASGEFGTANIFTFLYREPTTAECLNFNEGRWRVLRTRFQWGGMPNVSSGSEGAQADNGC